MDCPHVSVPSRPLHQFRVRLFGHLLSGFGLAGGARATWRALEAAGCQVWPVDLPLATHAAVAAEPLPRAVEGPVQVDLVHTNPNLLASTPELQARCALQAPLRVAYWAWELEQFPLGWERFFAPFHEIWCPSSFSAQSLAQRSPVPVIALPHLPDWPRLDRLAALRQQQQQQPITRPFTFLTLFDFWSTVERKNPLAVIEAFEQAFPVGEVHAPPVQLCIKTSSADQFANQAVELKARTAADRRIRWIDTLLTAAQLEQLYLSCDALVSLHRAEGFGLTLAEAMAMGMPVIATGYSGNLDFMPPGSAQLISWQLVPIARTRGDYIAGAHWAEPNGVEAAQAMRQLVLEPQAARALGWRGRRAVQERLAPERISAVVRQRLGRVLVPPESDGAYAASA